jgi:hypothetical protein
VGFDFDSTLPRFTDLAVTAGIECACKGGVWHNMCVCVCVCVCVRACVRARQFIGNFLISSPE